MMLSFLKYYTFLTKEEIEALEEKVKTEPHLREAQKVLAREVVTLVHGKEAYEEAVKLTEALFSGNIKGLNVEEIRMGFKNVSSVELKEDTNIVDALILVKAASSKREAREFINNGAVSINGDIVKDLDYTISKANAIGNEFTVIRRGKKNYYLIKH